MTDYPDKTGRDDRRAGPVLDRLVDAAPTAMAHLSVDGQGLRFNDRWTAVTGQATDEALDAGWESMVDSDGRQEFLADLAQSLSAGTPLRGRLRLVAAAGTTRWVD